MVEGKDGIVNVILDGTFAEMCWQIVGGLIGKAVAYKTKEKGDDSNQMGGP